MAGTKKKATTQDPLYQWLVGEIQRSFGFLPEEFALPLEQVEADARGCWLTYGHEGFKVQVWAEMGGRPEVDLVEDGKRRSLNAVVAERWPDRRLPPRPEYTGLEGEQLDFTEVLGRYSSVLRELLRLRKPSPA